MRKVLTYGILLSLFLGLRPAWAQNESADNVRHLTRGLLWTGYRNIGTQGGVIGDAGTQSAAPLSYPGSSMAMSINTAAPDYADYWGIKEGYTRQNQLLEAQNAGTGSGVWVLARAGDTYMTSYIS